MPPNPTDFYLNLDRWENLSAVERQRGAWQARLEGPSTRLSTIRQQAAFQAAWSAHLSDRPADSRMREIVLGPVPPDPKKQPGLLLAWRYCRAVRFVEGWYQAFPWTTASIDQVARLLLDPTEHLEEGLSGRLVAAHREAASFADEVGNIPIFQIAAFYGGIGCDWSPNNPYSYLYVLGLRILLLQKGYMQVLGAPIEPVILAMLREAPAAAKGSAPGPSAAQPEMRLSLWLDQVTDLLLDVGRRAEESWDRARSLEPRTALQETILTLALQHGRVTAGDVLRATGANRNTVKDNLARLVQEGSLQKHGQKRGTVYLPV